MKIQPDGLPIRFLTKVCDLMILNILFILGCVTIVFSGAAVITLYSVTLKMIQGKAYAPLKDFLRVTWENFIPSVPVTILLFADMMLIAFLHTVLYAETLLISPTLFIALAIAALVLTALLSWLFPLLAQFENTFPRHFGNAARLALANPEEVNDLYFPMASETGLKSAVTPTLGGDCKLDQETFLLEPVSSEDLHTSRSTRNSWCVTEKGCWSATGVSAQQEVERFTAQQDESSLTAGLMW